jgi:hypothetical protein
MAANGVVLAPAARTPEELFRASCNDFQRYPRNLIYKSCSEHSLKAYSKMLKSRDDDLFGHIDEAIIPMIELRADRKGKLLGQKVLNLLTLTGWYKKNICDDAELQTRLWAEQVSNQDGTTTSNLKADTRCRFL